MMNLRIRLGCSLIGLLACLPAQAIAGAPRYQLLDLGGLSGFTAIVPTAINDKEQIAGDMLDGNNQFHGFLWKNGRFTDLGPGDARGIDRAGQILMSNTFENFLWDDGVPVPLGEITSGDTQADALNDQGDIVGYVNTGGPSSGVYVWRNYKTHRLPLQWPASSPPGTSWKTSPAKINDQDSVIGLAVPPNSDSKYVFLYQNGKTTLIKPWGASEAWPAAINNKGWVLGGAFLKSIICTFIWRDGKLIRIGQTTNGAFTSPVAMNDQGQVIVAVNVTTKTNSPGENTSFPYLWQNGRLYDLKKLIVDGAGWTDLQITAMNDNGDIVGTGAYQGQSRAFLLTPAVARSTP